MLEGHAAIIAVPAAVLKTLAFEPELPYAKRDALHRLPISTAAKLFVPLAEVPGAPSATLSVPERYWAWTALGPTAGSRPWCAATPARPRPSGGGVERRPGHVARRC